jgi:hypothetical protein
VVSAAALRAVGLDPMQVGDLVADTFAEMALCHGHVHGDPHAGNIYVRAQASAAREARAGAGAEGEGGEVTGELVMLDHGQVHVLSEEARLRLCELVLACVERRGRDLAGVATEIAGPLHRFLPLLLSPSFALMGFFDGWLSLADLRAAARNEVPASVSLEDVGKCVAGMHAKGGNLLGVLHSMGYTRGLLAAIGFPERRRLKSLARFAIMGLLPAGQRKRALIEGGLSHAVSPAVMRRLNTAALQVDVSQYLMMTVLGGVMLVRVLGSLVVAAAVLYLLAAALMRLGWAPAFVTCSQNDWPDRSPLLSFLMLRNVPSLSLRRGRRDAD